MANLITVATDYPNIKYILDRHKNRRLSKPPLTEIFNMTCLAIIVNLLVYKKAPLDLLNEETYFKDIII